MNLIILNKKKKEKVFTDYVIQNRNSFYKVAYTYVKNENDALDIVQEAILKGLSKLKSLEDINYIKPWFYKILINTSIDYIRKNRKYINLEDESAIDSFIEHDIDLDIDIQRALDSLPEFNKTLIILRYFEDMKISDIANILEQNENTIKTKLYRTLKLLRIQIEDSEKGEYYE
ncbi:RNA polymerase sigma factor [Romboutsia sp.]|uniref:RNA polymerase sigma factor n=1 Tax=Romboutsia sp. TaxID=1965302 RepID=UPI003F330E3E